MNQTCHIAPGSLFEAGSPHWIEREQQAKGNSPFANLLTSMLKQEWCWLLKRNQLRGLNFSATATGNGKFFLFCFFVVTQGQKSRQNQGGSGNAGMEKTDPFHLSLPHVVIINGFQVLLSSITCLSSYPMLLLLSHFSRVRLCATP